MHLLGGTLDFSSVCSIAQQCSKLTFMFIDHLLCPSCQLGMINSESMVALLQSYTVVLDEPVYPSREQQMPLGVLAKVSFGYAHPITVPNQSDMGFVLSRSGVHYTLSMPLLLQTLLLPFEHTTTPYPLPHGRSSILSHPYLSHRHLLTQTRPTNFLPLS